MGEREKRERQAREITTDVSRAVSRVARARRQGESNRRLSQSRVREKIITQRIQRFLSGIRRGRERGREGDEEEKKRRERSD